MNSGVVRHELIKCFTTIWFYIALLVGVVIATFAALSGASYGLSELLSDDGFYVSVMSCFSQWIVVNCEQGLWPYIFFQLVPILAALPYTWSYQSEHVNGYEMQLATRAGASERLIAKAFAVFVSGFTVTAVSLIVNFTILACVLPALTPLAEQAMVTGIFGSCLFIDLFYSAPVLYVVAFTLLDSTLFGLWALVVFGASVVLRTRVMLIGVPYLILAVWRYVTQEAIALSGIALPSVNIIDAAIGTYYFASPNVVSIAVQALFMLIVSCVCIRILSKRDVI